MAGASKTARFEAKKTRIVLGLLEFVERGGPQSQRRLASELSIALCLVIAYLRRCIAKGLVKVSEAPARRCAYYLTPYGEYLSYWFSLFRRAKTDYTGPSMRLANEALAASPCSACRTSPKSRRSALSTLALRSWLLLFVGFDRLTQRWRSNHPTFGVTRLVCNGDDPVAVPPGVVEELRGHENDDGLIRLDIRPRLARGDKIRVFDGVFSACLGLFDGMAHRERVAILLDLLGCKVRVVLDGESVAAA